jgi:hypothetical protein
VDLTSLGSRTSVDHTDRPGAGCRRRWRLPSLAHPHPVGGRRAPDSRGSHLVLDLCLALHPAAARSEPRPLNEGGHSDVPIAGTASRVRQGLLRAPIARLADGSPAYCLLLLPARPKGLGRPGASVVGMFRGSQTDEAQANLCADPVRLRTVVSEQFGHASPRRPTVEHGRRVERLHICPAVHAATDHPTRWTAVAVNHVDVLPGIEVPP